MLRNKMCLVPQYFATSQPLLLLNGQVPERFLLYTGYARGHPLSLYVSNILVDYLLPFLLGNKLFSEIRSIFILWAAEQGLNSKLVVMIIS